METFSSGRLAPESADHLEADVLQCIRREEAPSLALWQALWRAQAEGCAPLYAFWKARGWSEAPDSLEAFDALPAIPTDAFRFSTLHAVNEPITRVFRTSGTTQGVRGVHARSRLEPYRLGAGLQWLRTYGQAHSGRPWLAMVPCPDQVPDSSLGFMVEDLARRVEASPITWAVTNEGLDMRAVVAWCEHVANHKTPGVLFGTTFAFHHLLTQGLPSFSLPEGTLILDTGGMKTHGEAMDAGHYREQLADIFGVPLTHQGAEYSMTELSSQLYTPWSMDPTLKEEACIPDRPARYRAPAWCRVTVVHPDTLAPLPAGEVGLIRFMDAANVDTCAWIQTSDLGCLLPGGDLIHLGRAAGAVPRGCSLALQELEALA